MAGRGDAGGVEAANARALELAYRYLNRRERTTEELRRRLGGRDLEPAAVDAAVAELTQAGHLDDARYARLYDGPDEVHHMVVARNLLRHYKDGAPWS